MNLSNVAVGRPEREDMTLQLRIDMVEERRKS